MIYVNFTLKVEMLPYLLKAYDEMYEERIGKIKHEFVADNQHVCCEFPVMSFTDLFNLGALYERQKI